MFSNFLRILISFYSFCFFGVTQSCEYALLEINKLMCYRKRGTDKSLACRVVSCRHFHPHRYYALCRKIVKFIYFYHAPTTSQLFLFYFILVFTDLDNFRVADRICCS